MRLAAGRLDVETSPKEIRVLCQSCAENIFANLGPSEQYALAVARLLFMVAAHESGGFQYRRQLGFAWSNGFGAHGLWQIEWASVSDSIGMLRRKSALAQRSARWLFRDSHAPSWWFDASINLLADNGPRQFKPLLVMMCGWDRLCCLFARLHFLRVPAAVPSEVEAQGMYAKQWYNTEKGKAAARDYVDAFNLYWPRAIGHG